jgi:hypothetical protein
LQISPAGKNRKQPKHEAGKQWLHGGTFNVLPGGVTTEIHDQSFFWAWIFAIKIMLAGGIALTMMRP